MGGCGVSWRKYTVYDGCTNLHGGRRRPQWSHDPGAVVADGVAVVAGCAVAAAAAVELRQRHVSSLYHYILLQLIGANQLDL